MGNIFSVLQNRYINYISNVVYKYDDNVEKKIYSIPFITHSINSFDSYSSNHQFDKSYIIDKNTNLPNYDLYKEANLTF
jgi:hypothetical protein